MNVRFRARSAVSRACSCGWRTEHHLLVLTFHHLLGNGPSYWVFLEELCALYEAESRPRAEVGTADAARRFRPLARGGSRAHRGGGRAFLAGAIRGRRADARTARRPAAAVVAHAPGRGRRLTLPKELTAALAQGRRRRDAARFSWCCCRRSRCCCTGSAARTIVVGGRAVRRRGAFAAGRRAAVCQHDQRLAAAQPGGRGHDIRGVCSPRRRTSCSTANEHQNYFFGRLLKKLGLRARPEPVADVLGVLQLRERQIPARTRRWAARWNSLTEDVPYRSPRDTAMFELYLNVAEKDGELLLRMRLQQRSFRRRTRCVRWLGHYRTLLEGSCSDPEAAVWTLPLLDAGEEQRILRDWNATDVGYPLDDTLHGSDRRAGATHAGSRGADFRRRNADLPPTRPPREPTRQPPPQRNGVGPETLVGFVRGAFGGNGRRRCSAFSRPAALTCRSTRTIRRNG